MKKPKLTVGKRRLLKLADLLDKDAKNRRGIKFNMGGWGEFIGSKPPKNPVSCGTQACAMGLAALSGAFKRDGLNYSFEREFSDITDNPKAYIWNIEFKWKGKPTDAITAAVRLFKIKRPDAVNLFMRWNEETGATAEREKAQQIRGFVAGGPSHRPL